MESFAKRFGDRVRAMRKAHRILSIDLAVYLHCDRSWISHIEAGRSMPSLEFLHRMAGVFGVDEVDLVTFPEAHLRHRVIDLTRDASPALLRQIEVLLTAEREAKKPASGRSG